MRKSIAVLLFVLCAAAGVRAASVAGNGVISDQLVNFSGDNVMSGNLTMTTGKSLTIPSGATLDVKSGATTSFGGAVNIDGQVTMGAAVSKATVATTGIISAVGFVGPLTGNADTASAFAATPTAATSGNVCRGVTAAGDCIHAPVDAAAASGSTNPVQSGALYTHDGLTGTSAHGAASANTASAIVARDGSGDFAAGTITASVTGAASLNVLKAGDTMTGAFAISPSTRTSTDDYVYISKISGDVQTGGASQKTYSLGILTNRPVGSPASGDSNDALIRASHNNYAANDSNFIDRGINISMNNRSGGTLGQMDNLLGNQNKSGGTVGTITGLTIVPENYGTVSDMFAGVRIQMKNEGATATSEYGVRVENLNNSLGTEVGAGYSLYDTGANIGFTYGSDYNGATVGTADFRLHSGDTINNAAAGTISVSGAISIGAAVKMKAKTIAELQALTPAAGDQYLCSNCVAPYSIAVATGTSVGNFAIVAPGNFQ
jgi:hypothetical protein